MSDQAITLLIEKLEGAEAGSPELDADVALQVGWTVHPGDNWIGPHAEIAVPDYTTSLDAALALADRVLTMGAWDVGYTYNSDRPYYARLVIVRDDEGQPEIYGRSATPALAICAAILRAHQHDN